MFRSILSGRLPAIAVISGARQTLTLVDWYDRCADRWHAMLDRLGYLAAYRQLALQADPFLPDRSQAFALLDVGTGSGALAAAFLNAGPRKARVTLLDSSPAMLRTATTTLRDMGIVCSPMHGDVGGNVLGTDGYDLVLCGHVLEHCEDPEASLAWLLDRLSATGLLVLVVSKPHWCTSLVRWRWRHRAFPHDRMEAMIARVGGRRIASIS
ncbi:MAG: class I SAM-dependent methyltransferase, partial [Pseudomonadota bacterium]